MRVSVHAQSRRVYQWGTSPGEVDDHVIEEVSEDTLAAIHAVQQQGDGGVILSPDHASLVAGEPSALWQAGEREKEERARGAEAAAALRTSDLAAVKAALPPEAAEALHRLLGG